MIVLDSVGIGALPDADRYGDEGSNTLGNLARAVGGLKLPHLGRLGLGNLTDIRGVPPVEQATAEGAFGRMALRSPGKDTLTGHWEMAGIIMDKPFCTYPHGFPPEIIQPFERAIGRPVLGNRVASGTEIIAELGEEHLRTGRPIVYTSADSVFQVAAHEGIIPVEELYRICEVARELLIGEHLVGRVIARPFDGSPGSFRRTERRRDFTLLPIGTTVLDLAVENGLEVVGVGKIEDIFAGRGITRAVHTGSNRETMEALAAELGRGKEGLVLANLVDFDMLYGHRNDPQGYAGALEEFDTGLLRLMQLMGEDDLLVVTADHGCDPTTPSTDHSREYVPLLVWGRRARRGHHLGTRDTLADLAATVASIFALPYRGAGQSFHHHILAE